MMGEKSDYTFRYPVEAPAAGSRRDSLLEMIRTQLESLLGLLCLYQAGEEVEVDGFRLMNEGESIHPIFPSGTDKAEVKAAGCTPDSDFNLSLNLVLSLLHLSKASATPSYMSLASPISSGSWRAFFR
jgi:hypothetical protein